MWIITNGNFYGGEFSAGLAVLFRAEYDKTAKLRAYPSMNGMQRRWVMAVIRPIAERREIGRRICTFYGQALRRSGLFWNH